MKKLLFQTDSSLAKTGFGRNAKALLSYLYKTKKYKIVQYCCGTSYSDPSLKRLPWKAVGTLPDDPNERHRISQDAGQARSASYGAYLIDKVIKEEKPDFYFGIQDIWGTEFAIDKPWFNKINSKNRRFFTDTLYLDYTIIRSIMFFSFGVFGIFCHFCE